MEENVGGKAGMVVKAKGCTPTILRTDAMTKTIPRGSVGLMAARATITLLFMDPRSPR